MNILPVDPIVFPSDTPGQTATRTVIFENAAPPAPEVANGTFYGAYDGRNSQTAVQISRLRPPAVPVGTFAFDFPTDRFSFTVGPATPVEGTTDRWSFELTVTTL